MSKFLESLVRNETKSCSGKIKFPREDSAVRSAADMMRKKKERHGTDEVFEAYKCETCDGWHIGHRTNFDWIPRSHKTFSLLLIQYECNECGSDFLTNTVMSNRVVVHFPGILMVPEEHVRCTVCKAFSGAEKGRKLICLAEVPEDSTESIQSLWNANTPIFTTTSPLEIRPQDFGQWIG